MKSTNATLIIGSPIMFSSRFLLASLFVLSFQQSALCQKQDTAQSVDPRTQQPPHVIGLPDPSLSSVEHWDKLSIQDSDLHPNPPIPGQTDIFPEFKRELLRVQWRDGDPIDLYIVRPAGISRPPVILYLYGYPGEAVRFLDPNFCKTVTKNGFAAVGFSSMLTGQRYHDVPMKQWFVSDLDHALVGTTHDVQMVLNYLEERGDFDTAHAGVFGEGSGGTIALLAASVDPRIKAVDVLNPWGDWPSWLAASRIVPDRERPDYLAPAFLKSIALLDPVHVLPRLSRTPLRLQQTTWDSRSTPAISKDLMAAALPSTARLVRYTDVTEYTEKAGSNGRMLDWIEGILSDTRPR